jgi:hypothetical protein
VTAYCGTFKDNPPDTNSGVFNIQVSLKGAVSGTYSGKNGNSGTLTGSVSGTSLTVSNGSPSAIKGTISGTKLSGTITFNDGTGGTGTFSGNKCDLPATK